MKCASAECEHSAPRLVPPMFRLHSNRNTMPLPLGRRLRQAPASLPLVLQACRHHALQHTRRQLRRARTSFQTCTAPTPAAGKGAKSICRPRVRHTPSTASQQDVALQQKHNEMTRRTAAAQASVDVKGGGQLAGNTSRVPAAAKCACSLAARSLERDCARAAGAKLRVVWDRKSKRNTLQVKG